MDKLASQDTRWYPGCPASFFFEELGATITFAGSFPGVTETMPMAVYNAANTDVDSAVALSVVLLAISFAVLISLQIGEK